MDGLDHDRRLLEALTEHTGRTAAAIARSIGVAATTISRPLAGKATTRLGQRTLEKLREEYPDFPGWEDGPALSAKASKSSAKDDDLEPSADGKLSIAMLELGYGMGGTFLDDNHMGEQVEDFPESFIRKFTPTPAHLLAWADGIGDSMYPTISDRDLLLIDRSNTSINMNDQIWALASGNIGMVKRVRMADGRVNLMSDNPHVSDYAAGEDELSVIGRVVAVVRRI